MVDESEARSGGGLTEKIDEEVPFGSETRSLGSLLTGRVGAVFMCVCVSRQLVILNAHNPADYFNQRILSNRKTGHFRIPSTCIPRLVVDKRHGLFTA